MAPYYTMHLIPKYIFIYPKSHLSILRLTEVSNRLLSRKKLNCCRLNNNFSTNLLKNKSPEISTSVSLPIHRHLSSQLSPQKNKYEENTKKEDSLEPPPEIGEGTWKEVYSGVLTTQLKLLKMFSIGSSVIGLSMQPILYEKLGTVNFGVVVTLASFLGFFTFITPALIHWVSKKYVTKLEYDPQKDVYAATTLSFFLKERKVHFKIEDVYRPEIPGMFTSFKVKNRSLFVDPSMFEDLNHYSRIMGYDKPIDFSFDRDKKRK